MVANQGTQEQTLERTLLPNDTIAEESWFDDDITLKLFRDRLFVGNGDTTIRINSSGDDCVAATRIYNMMMEYPGNVIAKTDGVVASAASVTVMVGAKVLVSPVSTLMAHNPMIVVMGDTSEIQKAIVVLDEVRGSITNAYEIKAGMSRAELSYLTDAETWVDTHTVINMGFANGILARSAETPVEDNTTGPMLFSRTAAISSPMGKLVIKCHIKKSETPGHSVDSLTECLDLIEQYI